MKTHLISVFATLLALITIVSCEEEKPAPVFNVGLTQTEVTVNADGGNISFSVTSNVAWKVSTNASWINSDITTQGESDKETTTKVTVTISPNDSYSERSATFTVSANGMGETTVTVTQKGMISKIINVKDASGKAISSIETTFLGGEMELKLTSNAESISLSSEASWLSITSGTYKPSIACTVSLNIEENKGSDRSTTITISGAGVETPVTLTVTQNGKTSVSITSAEVNYHKCWVKAVGAKETDLIGLIYSGKKVFDEDGVEGLANYQIERYNEYLKDYSESEVTSAVLDEGISENTLTGLEPETEYHIVVFAVIYANGKYVLASEPVHREIRTTATPVAEEEYKSLLGSYTINGKSATVDGEQGVLGNDLTWPLVLEEDDINESYTMTIMENKVNPVYTNGSKTYVDSFIMEYKKDSDGCYVNLPLMQPGSMGATWTFTGVNGYCMMVLTGYNMGTLKNDSDYIRYKWNPSSNSLTQTYPAQQYMLSMMVVSEAGELVGRYSDFMVVTSIDKVIAETPDEPKVEAISSRLQASTPHRMTCSSSYRLLRDQVLCARH